MNNLIVRDEKLCDGCGICVLTCPQMIYVQDAEKAVPRIVKPDLCLGCLACEEDCPKDALRVHRLPPGMTADRIPQPGAGLDPDRLYDLVVIGAGPAGCGAAIRARMLGLEAAVIERLPSPARAHHPDGGMLTCNPDIYRVEARNGGMRLDDIDVTIPAEMVRERLFDFVFMGPSGQSTRPTPRDWDGFAIVSKDAYVELLANEARNRGATIAFNTRAKKIERDGKGAGVLIDGDRLIRGKVVVSAEGITGRLASRAGAPVNVRSVGWSYAVFGEFPPVENPTMDIGFFVGSMPGCKEELKSLGFWESSKRTTNLGVGPLQEKKYRAFPRPLTDCFQEMLKTDSRLQKRLGKVPAYAEMRRLDGCRVFVRRLPQSMVSDGLIAAGDAFTPCGMLTNVLALKAGDVAAQVAHAAIRRGDVSASSLAEYDRRIPKLSMVRGMSWMHNLLIQGPLDLPIPKLDELYNLLTTLELGGMMRGGSGAGWKMLGFYLRNTITMMMRPDLRKYLVP